MKNLYLIDLLLMENKDRVKVNDWEKKGNMKLVAIIISLKQNLKKKPKEGEHIETIKHLSIRIHWSKNSIKKKAERV